MAGVDKAAIGWTIAIVAVGVGIAVAGLSGQNLGTVAAPSIPTYTPDDRIAQAKETIAQEQRMKEESMMKDDSKMMEDRMMEDKMKDDRMMEDKMKDDAMKMDDKAASGPTTYTVSMPVGSGLPGCVETDECYIPSMLTINAGDTVSWSNDEQVPHTVTAGDITADPNTVGFDYPNGFDSQFMTGGQTYENTFETPGTYPYFCQLHPWMKGTIVVN